MRWDLKIFPDADMPAIELQGAYTVTCDEGGTIKIAFLDGTLLEFVDIEDMVIRPVQDAMWWAGDAADVIDERP